MAFPHFMIANHHRDVQSPKLRLGQPEDPTSLILQAAQQDGPSEISPKTYPYETPQKSL